ncbi:MAG TPA: hypothetical protein VFI29_08490 [Hanamia sp.]|nr:hypothetical protein [Hanamia sp.]
MRNDPEVRQQMFQMIEQWKQSGQLPEHLERREFIIEPLQKVEGCKKIGDEVTEELEYEPGRMN